MVWQNFLGDVQNFSCFMLGVVMPDDLSCDFTAQNTPMPSTNQTNTKHHTPVLIVGGGHVGLSFALLLAHAGVSCVLIEKTTYPKISPSDDMARTHYLDSRNTALSRRSVEIYRQMGLWEHLQKQACRIDYVKIFEKNSFGKATLDKAQEGVESFGQVMENAYLGHNLLQAVQNNPAITLIDGVAVQAISQDDKQACAVLDDGRVLVAKLLVACDGQHSPVRHLLGVTATYHDYQQVAIVGVVMTQKAHEHTAIECFSPAGPLALLPLTDKDGDGNADYQQGHRRSVVWICQKGEEDKYLNDETHFAKTLAATFGELSGEMTAVGKRGAYPLSRVLATKQVVGRCVLMGNAAHTLHPVAGQGFNLCLRDAYALAKLLGKLVPTHGLDDMQKLALALADYERVRLSDQKKVIFFCDAVVGGFTHANVLVKWARNLGLLIFDKVPLVKPMVATFAMGLKSEKLDNQSMMAKR